MSEIAADLRTLEEEELVTKLRESKEELFNLRFQAATGQLESHGRLRAVRRDIARIYTVMRERELGIVQIVEDEAETTEPETTDDETGDDETGDDETGGAETDEPEDVKA